MYKIPNFSKDLKVEELREKYAEDSVVNNILDFYEYIKEKQGKLKADQRVRSKNYYHTEKGRANIKASQKKYYLKNKERIRAKYHEKKKCKVNNKETVECGTTKQKEDTTS